MRNWNKRLFLGALPGLRGSLDDWFDELIEHNIQMIVSLISVEQISEESPDFAEWRRAPLCEKAGVVYEVAVLTIPVADYDIPIGRILLRPSHNIPR